jgi:hypothetical protein
LALVSLGVISLAASLYFTLPGVNLPRIAGILVPPVVAMALALRQWSRRAWYVHLAWHVIAVALAALAWWFMPTTRGLTYWEARHRLTQLDQVAAGDLAEFLPRHAACQEAADQFPDLAARTTAIRDKWTGDTVEAAVAEAQALLPGDPVGASARLKSVRDDLALLSDSPKLTKARQRVVSLRLEAAAEELAALETEKKFPQIDQLRERLAADWGEEAKAVKLEGELHKFLERCATATVRPEVEQAEEWLRKGDFDKAATCLRQVVRERAADLQFDAANTLVRDARRRVVQGRLEAARKEFLALVEDEKYADVALLQKRLAAEWGDEAKAAGTGPELDAFVQQCAFLLKVARSAGKLP